MDIRRERFLRYLLGVALPGLIASIVSAYVGYKKATFEADAGYQALVASVKEMQPAIKSLSREVAELSGRVDVLQAYLHTAVIARLSAPAATPRPASPPAARAPTHYKMSAPPDDLNGAVMQQMKR